MLIQQAFFSQYALQECQQKEELLLNIFIIYELEAFC